MTGDGVLSADKLASVWEGELASTMKPLETWYGFAVRPGLYLQNGVVAIPGGVNFTVHSEDATGIDILLFHREEEEPYAYIPFPEKYRVGDVYSMILFDLDIADLEYAFRVYGPFDPANGYCFDAQRAVVDPYARKLRCYGKDGNDWRYPYRGVVVLDVFDWGQTVVPSIPQDEMIIYELHVKGFTQALSSGVEHRGSFRGLIEKIPYLKELGINVVELMPVFEFDEMLNPRSFGDQILGDYWGYNPLSFFAPNREYASEEEGNFEGCELKALVAALHENGIEVILDVVFNHTAEGNEDGPTVNFRGFDNRIYYMLGPGGRYMNFSGCGNTLNANHPIVRQLILDCLRFWVIHYRIDGFRFDLASILGRNEDGSPMSDPPLLESLAYDPVLKKAELIAEAWDAGGLYQVGSFPSWNRWAEWNGRYRDDMRCFLKGDYGLAKIAGERICGSRDLYPVESRGKYASVNFITCHDGFTLRDLYSYNVKHNLANGWNNTDGESHNNSWNCGVEGESFDPNILRLRQKLILNACVVLLASRGTPMILAGDEFGNTQWGNNNPYCQDNEISWLDWTLLERNRKLFNFWKKMIRLRKVHSVLRGSCAASHNGLPSSSIHSREAWREPQREDEHYVGVMFAGYEAQCKQDEVFYIAVNSGWERCTVNLPTLPHREYWRQLIDTELDFDRNFVREDEAPLLERHLNMAPRSVALLIAHPLDSWEAAQKQRQKVEADFAACRRAMSQGHRPQRLSDIIISGTYTQWKDQTE